MMISEFVCNRCGSTDDVQMFSSTDGSEYTALCMACYASGFKRKPHDVARKVFDSYAAIPLDESLDEPMSNLQVELCRWQAKNFGGGILWQQALGVCEEAGELAHAVLKHAQRIRGYDDREKFVEEAGDAIADCAIYLMQVCTILRLDFETLLEETALRVMNRDWKRSPRDGGE